MSNENKFTPGPWLIDLDNATGVEVVGANGDLVHIEHYDAIPSEFGPGRADAIIATARANAKLIAAAPELLEALQMICDSGVSLSDEIEKKMLAAITKATA